MRHGKALSHAKSDSLRALSDAGRKQIQLMLEYYGDKLGSVDAIWSSHYLRARQTAEIMADHCRCPHLIQPWLTPLDRPDQVLASLEKTDNTVLIVSHQPLVGDLLDHLGGFESGRYYLGTAAIACLQFEWAVRGCAELLWLHQPTEMHPNSRD
ncbi:MAG: phosphohistidine phosphatase [Cellvibrionaceae bacterium]|jgi:phosphohistidine phosphatase